MYVKSCKLPVFLLAHYLHYVLLTNDVSLSVVYKNEMIKNGIHSSVFVFFTIDILLIALNYFKIIYDITQLYLFFN